MKAKGFDASGIAVFSSGFREMWLLAQDTSYRMIDRWFR